MFNKALLYTLFSTLKANNHEVSGYWEEFKRLDGGTGTLSASFEIGYSTTT